MRIAIINGPNINLLGIREPDVYGKTTYESLKNMIDDWAKELKVDVMLMQSNVEGEIVNFIQQCFFEKVDGIVINPAAYTHTSVAILDALKAVNIPAIEVHISDINEREEFRKFSFIKEYCIKTIVGEGVEGYHHAMIEMKDYLEAR